MRDKRCKHCNEVNYLYDNDEKDFLSCTQAHVQRYKHANVHAHTKKQTQTRSAQRNEHLRTQKQTQTYLRTRTSTQTHINTKLNHFVLTDTHLVLNPGESEECLHLQGERTEVWAELPPLELV